MEEETSRVPSKARSMWEPRELALVPPLAMGRMPVMNPAPMEVVPTICPAELVERSALVRPVSHVVPLLVACVVDALPLESRPTTVEDACETKPFAKVPRPVKMEVPVTPKVDENVPAPPVSVPTGEMFEYERVEEEGSV